MCYACELALAHIQLGTAIILWRLIPPSANQIYTELILMVLIKQGECSRFLQWETQTVSINKKSSPSLPSSFTTCLWLSQKTNKQKKQPCSLSTCDQQPIIRSLGSVYSKDSVGTGSSYCNQWRLLLNPQQTFSPSVDQQLCPDHFSWANISVFLS